MLVDGDRGTQRETGAKNKGDEEKKGFRKMRRRKGWEDVRSVCVSCQRINVLGLMNPSILRKFIEI